MAIIANLTRLIEEFTAQKMSPAPAPATVQYSVTDPVFAAIIKGPDPDRLMFQEIEAEEEDWPYTDEDYSSNMPCDFSGYCAGTNCPNFFKCKGFTK